MPATATPETKKDEKAPETPITPEAKAAIEAKAKADAEAAAKAGGKKEGEGEGGSKEGEGGKKEDFLPTGLDKEVATKFAEKVRQQEKAKLYPKLEALQKDLKSKDEALATAQAELKAAKEAAEAAGTKGLTETQILQKEVDALKKQVTATNEAIVKEKAEAEQKVRNAELQAYRERKLRDAGGSLIPELVVGATEEELDASVEASKAQYKAVYDKALAEAKASVSKVETTTVTNPQGGSHVNPNLADPKVVKEIPLKDWKAKRAETLLALAKAEGRA